MARKSRKENSVTIQNLPLVSDKKIYRTAIYVRLSSEDERKILSESVENQIALLKDFVDSQEDLQLVGCYVDRGISGTKFNRPDFNQLVADMKAEKFDCVVVKDLSRLGRDYLTTGEYLETIFPFYHIRFIAVTDGYDSLNASAAQEGLLVPFKNMVNEAYAKDISKKISGSIEEMQKAGLFVGKFAPYGYIKDPKNIHRLIVDEAVKENVILIFESRAAGMSVVSITKMLNERNITPPMKRRKELAVGKKYKYADKLWDKKLVSRILRNVAYMGDMEQGFEKAALYLGIKERNRGAEKRYYVKNTHEPIVSRELFEKVQLLMDDATAKMKSVHSKYKDVERKSDIFQGLLYCGHCNRLMTFYRRTMELKEGYGHYYTYMCRYASDTYNAPCVGNRIKMEDLEEIVATLLHQHIRILLDAEAVLRKLNSAPVMRSIADDYGKEIAELHGKVEHSKVIVSGLYNDFADGILDEQEYLYAKQQYVNTIEKAEKQISELEAARDTYRDDYSIDNTMEAILKKYYDFTELTPELLNALIDRIVYYGDGRYEVKYKFGLELDALQQLIEQREEEVACRKAV